MPNDSTPSGPEITVAIPLQDYRGDVAEHVRSWTERQTLDRNRYALAIAYDGDPAARDAVAPLLGPQDQLVAGGAGEIIGLFNAAISAARAPWIVVTEAHCLGAPDCLERFASAVARDPHLDAAHLAFTHAPAETVQQTLCQGWFDQMFAAQAAPGARRPLNFAAMAIRRDAWERHGPLDVRYHQFSPDCLSDRLRAAGCRIGTIPDARVRHIADPIREHHELTARFTRGECFARAEMGDALSEERFGYEATWHNRALDHRALVRTLIAFARGDPTAAPWALAEIGRMARRGDGAISRTRDRALVAVAQPVIERLPRAGRAGLELWLASSRALVRKTRAAEARRIRAVPAPRTTGYWAAPQLDGTLLAGAHGLATHDGLPFRWTDPVVQLRLAPPAGEHRLRIETGGLRGASPLLPLRAAYAGTTRVPDVLISADGDAIEIGLPDELGRRVGSEGITLITEPLEPHREGSPDKRRLGLPVFAVELQRSGMEPAPLPRPSQSRRMPAPKPSPAPAPALSEAIIVNTSDSGGGAERIATTLLDGFEQRGVRTRLVVGDRRRDDARVVALHESSVFDYRPSARLDRRLRSRTRRRLDRRRGYEDFEHPYSHHLLELLGSRPDVVVCENLHGGYFDLRALRELARQVPVVLRLDDSWLLTGHCAVTHGCERWETGCGSCPDLARPPAVQRDATAENWRRKRSMLSGLELAAVAPSRWMLERAQRSLLAGAIADWREIPDGIDLETFRPGDPGPGRATLGVGPGCVVALFVAAQGARNPHKDFTTLRAAFAGAAQDATAERPLELVVVGATAPTEQLTPHARIRHLAFEHSPAKLAELYRAADVYVHAAMEETRSLVASEALACGTPVAAAAAGGIREVVRDGRTGYVVAPGDTAGLALAVGRLAADSGLRAGLGSAAAEDARERFDVKGMVDAMHAFCEELVVRRPGAFKPTGEIGTIPT